MATPSDGLHARFLRLRDLAKGTRAVFGSTQHGWRTDPPFTEPEMLALEKKLGAPMPPRARAFFCQVTRGPMGPDHGFVALRKNTKKPSDLVIADEGGGVAVVLVLSGPRKGSVVGVKGSKRVARAATFDAYLETWLTHALLEWAEGRLFEVLCGGAAEAILADVRAALVHRATLGEATERTHAVSLLVAAVDGDREGALASAAAAAAAFVDVNADRRDPDALEDEAGERRARLALHRARILKLAGDLDAVKREVDTALREPGAWESTKDALRALR